MKLIGIVILIAAAAMICWIYYFLLRIAIAIWIPKKAKKEWVAMAESLPMYPFFKWVAPVWVLLATVYAAIQLCWLILHWVMSSHGAAI